MDLTRPILPPLQITYYWLGYIDQWVNTSNRFPNQTLVRGFLEIPGYEEYGLASDIVYVLRTMGSFTLAIEDHLRGNPGALVIGIISRVRGATHQQVLLLPSLRESTNAPSGKPSIYSACRTTALIYSIAVLFPVPNPSF